MDLLENSGLGPRVLEGVDAASAGPTENNGSEPRVAKGVGAAIAGPLENKAWVPDCLRESVLQMLGP